MFTEFANQTWGSVSQYVSISNFTDYSIDGSCKALYWANRDAEERDIVLTFDSIILSSYEEISLYISYTVFTSSVEELFSITIDGQTFDFNTSNLKNRQWNHILIDCSKMVNAITAMTFTNIANDIALFVDYIGYRKVTYNCDMDIIERLKSHINLDYDVATTLLADADIGDTSIEIDYDGITDYVTSTSVLEIDDGAGTIETVELIDTSGTLKEPVVHEFVAGAEVRVICPVRSEDYDDVQPDPVLGIAIYDMDVDSRLTTVPMASGSKIKEYLGTLGVVIYIDCSSKKKLLQMSREYNKKYGKSFQFLLDGEQVEIYMDSSVFADDVIGNNPRMAYYYKIEPQPSLIAQDPQITTITMTVQSDIY